MDEALYIFDIVLASEDGGKTNKVVSYRCWADSYLLALKLCIARCEEYGLAAVEISENFKAEMEA